MTELSLQERIAERHRRVREERTVVLPVPGFSDLLAARYRPLPIQDRLRILRKHQNAGEDGDDLVAAAADVLINACEDLLEKNGSDWKSLGKKWTSSAIGELFPVAISEDTTAREALTQALTSDQIVEHSGEYNDECDKIRAELEGATEGESKATSVAP